MCFAYPAAIPPHLVRSIAPVGFIAHCSTRLLTPDTLVLADDRMVTATAWALRRSDIGVYRRKSELAYGLDRPEAKGRFYSEDDLKRLVEEKKQPILVVVGNAKRVREMPVAPGKSYYRSGKLFLVYYRSKGMKKI